MEQGKFSSNQLKLVACLCMACDHVGLVLMDNQWMMRAIGRLAFPIFAFLLVEGYRHTSDVRRYSLRLFVCALLSELPFDLAFYGRAFDLRGQNVFFTLTAGLLLLCCERIAGRNRALAVCVVLCIMAVCWIMRFDYQIAGILILLVFSIRNRRIEAKMSESGICGGFLRENLITAGAIAGISFLFYGVWELPAALAILPISLYSGRLGKRSKAIQYGFYLFYPAHLALLAVISLA